MAPATLGLERPRDDDVLLADGERGVDARGQAGEDAQWQLAVRVERERYLV